jgi:hypothetical protein
MILTVLCGAVSGLEAQPAPQTQTSSATAQSEAGEPRADTSNPPSGDAVQPLTPPPAAAHGRRTAASTARGGAPPAPGTAAPAAPGANASPAGAPAPVAPAQKGSGKADRLDLGTATVTGDREQPKVMYIVPWKRSDIGDLAGKPMNSLVDEILAPVDRDVFKREVIYYRAVQADASQNGAPPKPAPQGEK